MVSIFISFLKCFEDANAVKEDKDEENKAEEPKPINDTNPLYLKIKDCTKRNKISTQRFFDFNEPLFADSS